MRPCEKFIGQITSGGPNFLRSIHYKWKNLINKKHLVNANPTQKSSFEQCFTNWLCLDTSTCRGLVQIKCWFLIYLLSCKKESIMNKYMLHARYHKLIPKYRTVMQVLTKANLTNLQGEKYLVLLTISFYGYHKLFLALKIHLSIMNLESTLDVWLHSM